MGFRMALGFADAAKARERYLKEAPDLRSILPNPELEAFTPQATPTVSRALSFQIPATACEANAEVRGLKKSPPSVGRFPQMHPSYSFLVCYTLLYPLPSLPLFSPRV
jgi:hypothetical protein